MDKILLDFEHIIENAAYERSLQEEPGLLEKFPEYYSHGEKKIFNRNYYDIKNTDNG